MASLADLVLRNLAELEIFKRVQDFHRSLEQECLPQISTMYFVNLLRVVVCAFVWVCLYSL